MMHCRIYPAAVVILLGLLGSAPGQEAASKDLNTLSMEIAAMRKLDGLSITRQQLKIIAGWVNETSEKPRDRDPARVNLKFRKAILELHAALAQKKPADVVIPLQMKANDIKALDRIELDDDHGTTAPARKRAQELFKTMKTPQVAALLTSAEDSDPEELLHTALKRSRELKDKEWRDARDEAATELAHAIGGTDDARAQQIKDQVVAMLDKAHALPRQDFARAEPDLERQIARLAGMATPIEVLRNRAILNLATVLSNPTLPAVTQIRLKVKE
jgi:hypothetical protein